MPNKKQKITLWFIVIMLFEQTASFAAAPSTADFMNALTACGAGVTIKLDANLKGSLKSIYDGEATQGRSLQEIIPKISEKLPEGENYKMYLDCLDKLLSK